MDRFLIAPLTSGLQTDLKPWMIPDDAYTRLDNAYVWRGRVRKRVGSIGIGEAFPGATPLNSRVRIKLGTTNGAGNLSGTVPGAPFKIGQLFSVGTRIYTVDTLGVPANLLQDGATTTATFNTTTGAFVFVGSQATADVYFYPSNPIMGLEQYQSDVINDQFTYAFDRQFAYFFDNAIPGWDRSGIPQWHGSNSDFFWGYNWVGVTNNIRSLFVTNFYVTNFNGLGVATDDPIWSLTRAGSVDTWSPLSYSPDVTLNPTNQQPYTVTQATKDTGIAITNYVQTARIIVAFKGRLLLLNTVENNANGATPFNVATPTITGITPANYLTSTNSNFYNRVRWSQVGGPFERNAWLETNQVFLPTTTSPKLLQSGGGGFLDAATDEAIVSAEFIKDRLIVYFENSTWELVYQSNQLDPFTWQKINTELGSVATFSTIPFDKSVLTVGSVGIHACNGANVARIDDNIADEIFTIREDNEGLKRIAGIRDYFLEMAYWAFPQIGADVNSNVYPNKMLVYNYKTGAWALNDDTFTAFGYFDLNQNISSGTGIGVKQVLAGNQHGYVAYLIADVPRNAPSLQITGIVASGSNVTLTVIDHTLFVGDFVRIENAIGAGLATLNGNIYKVITLNSPNSIDVGIFDGTAIGYAGTYQGGGTLRRVSKINLLSKQWNPYVGQDRNFYLAKIDFAVGKTDLGQVQVDYYPSSTSLSMLSGATGAVASGAILGSTDVVIPAFGTTTKVYNALETSPYATVPLEAYQTILWHPINFQTQGTYVQILITMADAQMSLPVISQSDFQLEGLIVFTEKTSARLQ